jgi:hypothetical protein
MTFEPTRDEIADRWADAYARITEFAADFGDHDLAVTVPGTPKWSVRELMCHVVGSPIDLVAGKFEGAGGDEWTQRQVDARAGCGLAQLLEEWDGARGSIEAAARAGDLPSPVAFDILTHESDFRGALQLPRTDDPLALRFVTDGFAARAVKVAAKKELPVLELVASDTGWRAGAPGGVAATATEHEWTRALTGRRSNAQVAAYDWTGDPSPYLDLLSPFGPLRDHDVVE